MLMLTSLFPRSGIASLLPAWVPEGAVAHLDFVEERYFAGGAQRAAVDILGGNFDPDSIGPRGMFMTDVFGFTNAPDAAAALFDDLLAAYEAGGARLVTELDTDDAGGGNPRGALIMFSENAVLDNATDYTIWNFNHNSDAHETYDLRTLGVFGDDLAASGIQRLACQLNRDLGGGSWEYAVCANGGTVASGTVAYGGAYFTTARILLFHRQDWDVAMNEIYVRSLTLYPAGDKADLVALTA